MRSINLCLLRAQGGVTKKFGKPNPGNEELSQRKSREPQRVTENKTL